jgi:hypothetical protein
VVVTREAYKEAWLQGPSAVVALPAACIGKYRALQGRYAIFSILLTGSFVRNRITCTSCAISISKFVLFLPPPLLTLCIIVEGCGLRQADNRLMSVLSHSHNGKPNVKHTPRALRRQKVAGHQPQDHGLCRLQEAEDQVPHAGWPSTLLTLQEKRTLLHGQQELANAP